VDQVNAFIFSGIYHWLKRELGMSVMLAFGVWLCIPASIEARNTLGTERSIGELIQSKASSGAAASQPDRGSLGVLPQLGYDPEQGPKAGIKFVGRNLGGTGLTLDFNMTAALKGQQSYSIGVLHAELFNGRLITALNAGFFSDPTREFFGLGNNEVGSMPLSTHRVQRIDSEFTVAWRLFEPFAVALSAGYRNMQIGRGTARDAIPFTVDAFPNLTGVDGGHTIPLTLSLIYNSRHDVTRPTRGWSLIAEVEYVNRSLGSDFEFTRLSLDVSYLLPLMTRRQLLAFRLDGVHMLGDLDDIPFYELTELGGSDSLRGFFAERFLGKSRLLGTVEYRLKLLDFQFFNLWQVRIDGVGFIEAGRVFLDGDEIDRQFTPDQLGSRLSKDIQYSYGGGLRIALGQSILARIDVGFSDEESALVYLTFGQTF
jgi:outer membrane protein assembly factor BamA